MGIVIVCIIILSAYLIIFNNPVNEIDSTTTFPVAGTNFTVDSNFTVVNQSANYAILTSNNESQDSNNSYQLLVQTVTSDQITEFTNNYSEGERFYTVKYNADTNTYLVNRSRSPDTIEYIEFGQKNNTTYLLQLTVNRNYYQNHKTDTTVAEQLNNIVSTNGLKQIN